MYITVPLAKCVYIHVVFVLDDALRCIRYKCKSYNLNTGLIVDKDCNESIYYICCDTGGENSIWFGF